MDKETSPTSPTQPVSLLSDQPASSDEFNAGAHGKVAAAIAHLVRTEQGGRAIGLEGTWGSGKSTVVRIMRDALVEEGADVDIETVVFDAWAHQGDPLRRTFLEKLADGLEAAGWLNRDATKDLRAKLSGNHSKVWTKSSARLSLEGRFVAAAAALVPLGAVLFAQDFKWHHKFLLKLGAILLVAPLIVALAFAALKLASILLGGKRRSTGLLHKLACLPTMSFFAREQQTDTKSETIESGNPTSVEFASIFGTLLKRAMTDKRRLVIVLDNIDRVDENNARDILATMQTFMGASGEALDSRVWTVIPYDRVGLQRLWAPSAPEGVGEVKSNQLATSAAAAAFADKLFEIRFEAPPLVLSEWRGYLLRLLQEALPGRALEELRSAVRLRSSYPAVRASGLVAEEAPTPRQLKQFVNQVGSILRQRSDIPIVHVAYYVLLRRDSVEVQRDLITGSVPDPKLIHLLKAGVRDDLAALHFGTNHNLAQQLLIGPELERAFGGGTTRGVESLKDRPGFVDALDSLDWESQAADGAIGLTMAVAVLHSTGALDVPDVSDWFADVLEPLASQVGAWRLDGRDTGVGLALVAHRASRGNRETLVEIVRKVKGSPTEADEDGRRHLEGVAGLLDELVQLGVSDTNLRIELALSADRLIPALGFIGREAPNNNARAMVRSVQSPSEVAEALVGAATSDAAEDVDSALDVLLTGPDRVDVQQTVSAVAQVLHDQDQENRTHLNALLTILDRGRRAGGAQEGLEEAADNGGLMQAVYTATTNEWFPEAAGASMLHLATRPMLTEPNHIRSSPSGIQILREALSDPTTRPDLVASQRDWLIFRKREAFGILVSMLDNEAATPWVQDQIKALVDQGELVLTANQYLTHWRLIHSIVGAEAFAQLTRGLLDRPATREKVLESNEPALALAALHDGDPESEHGSEIREWAGRAVSAAPTAEWSAALADPSGNALLVLASELTPQDLKSEPRGLKDAIHPHAQALAEGEGVWQPDGDSFLKVVLLLGASTRHVLASQLCAELEGRAGQLDDTLFDTYGPFLAGEEAFRTHEKLPNVIERLVATDGWRGVEWFVATAREHPDALDPNGRSEEFEHLRKRISERSEALGDEAPEALRDISALWAVKR